MKILVNNEEVVSNSNLQIKEEMLSTSSTILKNCYPKTWEEDKDYVSRYYFPKDYSKCKIVNEIEHPEIPGTTTKGTNLNIDYDDSLKWELNGLFGDTFQQTYTGKNLCGIPDQTITKNGVTITIKDGEITLNGTASANGTQYLTPINTTTLNGKSFINIIYVSGTVSTTNPPNFNVRNASTQAAIFSKNLANENSNGNYTFSEETEIIFGIYVRSGNVFNNYKFKPQLTMGTSSDYNYEPYVGGVSSPNPSYPQSIENVTGLQNIEICGKNLLNADSIIPAMINSQSYSSSTLVYDNVTKTLTMTNPNTDTYLPAIYNNANNIPSVNINVKKNTTYTLHFDIDQPSSTWKNCVMGLDKSVNKYKYITNLGEVNTITFNTGNYDTIAFRIGSKGSVGTVTKFSNFQLEEGSSTEYEPYKGNTYEVNLGKNLFDSTIINGVVTNTNINTTSTTRICTQDFIKVQPNTTYTLSFVSSIINNYNVSYFTTNGFPRSSQTNWVDISNPTFTTPSTTNYILITFRKSDDSNVAPSDITNVQLEKGSTATSYSPYFTPIELNKIGTYQDRIYKDNDKWYIEKNIGKVVLDGSENWGLFFSTNGVFLCNTLITSINNATTINCISNYYSNEYSRAYVRSHLDTIDNACATNGGELILANKSITSVSNFKTWLSTHNTEVDYVLATPEITEITNEDLINQLEVIYYDMLNNGINNIIISSENLSMPIEIHYNFKEAWTEEELIFSGLVKNTGKISLNPRQPHYVDLQILDFKDLLSTGETLNYVISGKTITEAINQVVSSISDYGFVVGNINLVNPNELIGAYSTLNKTAYDVFQYIADITQSRWSTRVIDENTIAIDFNDPSLMEEGTPIESTQEFYEDNEINDISFSYSTNDYRNKQIITSDEVYGNVLQTETKVADGYTKTFVCENKIGTITGITLNGVNATFITKSDEALGLSGDFIYQPGETTFISSNTIATGGVIVISYYPIVKGREIVINSTEISRINEQINRKGTISRYENRNDSTSSQELIKIGQSYIKYKGQAEITLKVVSTKNIWNIGQIVSYDAPLEELTTDYMVKSKIIDMYLNANKTFYTYELTSNYNYENAINYFDNQRAKNQGNIGEGEVITRNIDLESTALIKFYDTSIEEVSIGTDSTLDFQLDSVII